MSDGKQLDQDALERGNNARATVVAERDTSKSKRPSRDYADACQCLIASGVSLCRA